MILQWYFIQLPRENGFILGLENSVRDCLLSGRELQGRRNLSFGSAHQIKNWAWQRDDVLASAA